MIPLRQAVRLGGLLILLAAPTVAGAEERKPANPLEQAETALEDKRWAEAQGLATQAVVAAHRVRGWAFYRLQKYPESLQDFTAALQQAPDDYDATLGLGRCHRLLKRYDEAAADFTRAIELAPGEARPYCERGAIVILQDKFDAAVTDYLAAEKINPHYPALYSYFAEAYLYQRDPAKALAAAEKGLQSEPGLLIHRVNLAHCNLFLGNVDKAKEIYLANKKERDPVKPISFADIVVEDFRLLRLAGITHPMMDSIEAAMRAP